MNKEKRRILDAMNRSLSGLSADPFLAQRVIAEAEGETKMKKHISRGLDLAMALMLALMGTAYAAFSSQVAEFFIRHFGKERGEWMQDGKMAQVGESFQIGGVNLTLDEVVYRDRGLYAVGTVRAQNEKDVLVPEGEKDYFEYTDEGQALARKAKETGGKMLNVEAFVGKIGVDDGEMLTPGCAGYYNVRNEDGTMTFSLEVEDGFSLQDGAKYTLDIDVRIVEVNEAGISLEDTAERSSWLVACEPKWPAGPTQAPAQADTGILIPQGEYDLLVPEE